ncbi:unnamed protein product [Chondrus crispus]|uniref:Uncharacterized protein n=1 Tax=Chondrus crispus TaxID=2769 RepID=R7Q346_CHOCR|nr:unnamed protein product [Chondrus crispus]CDF32439.1 unnamed protein product [Chondrus crispus]|eukprot:XP_005712104.1 unnamed protein product [Chondrus crispus]
MSMGNLCQTLLSCPSIAYETKQLRHARLD